MDTSGSRLEKYCCGCGLCNAFCEGRFDERGFFRPGRRLEESEFDTSLCYCNSLTGAQAPRLPWGPLKETCYSWSSDPVLRKQASSGGTLTALCMYLLEHDLVDGVLQVGTDPADPMQTVAVVSGNVKEVQRCMGSRYTGSAPFVNLFDLVEENKRYAVVAKPCDIRVLRSWISSDSAWEATFPYLLSFFCGGTPTRQANRCLLASMGVETDDVDSFRYRGFGWPGLTTAFKKDGSVVETEYEQSWGTILGRDLQEVCRFCWEGTGEAADVSCGDGWEISAGTPTFVEAAGRNLTFVRTEVGESLFAAAVSDGLVVKRPLNSADSIDQMQPGQSRRKAAMFSFVLAMRFARRATPKYSIRQLAKWSTKLPVGTRVKMFAGTLRRVVSGKV